MATTSLTADAEPISIDGAWHEYIAQAYATMTQMCRANSAKLCESFR